MLINVKEAYTDRVPLKQIVLAHAIRPTRPINEITEELLKDIKSALKGCLAYDGVGISANQLGINKSFFLIREDGENFKIYINPKIHSMSQEKLKEKEGCLSVPRYSLLVERSNQIKKIGRAHV